MTIAVLELRQGDVRGRRRRAISHAAYDHSPRGALAVVEGTC